MIRTVRPASTPALVVAVVVVALALPGAAAAADPLRPQQWNLDLVEADAARATSTGAGAVVAVVDSGVAVGHPDLAGRLVAGRDVVEGDDTPDDGDGHGTHVAGIVGAATGNGVGVESVAPGAGVMPVRVLAADGSASARVAGPSPPRSAARAPSSPASAPAPAEPPRSTRA